VIVVPDHVYVFYAYWLYFADKDIYMIRYFYHKIDIVRVFLIINSMISVSAILVARNVITLCCIINIRTLYHGPSTSDVPHTCALVARAPRSNDIIHTLVQDAVTSRCCDFTYSLPSA